MCGHSWGFSPQRQYQFADVSSEDLHFGYWILQKTKWNKLNTIALRNVKIVQYWLRKWLLLLAAGQSKIVSTLWFGRPPKIKTLDCSVSYMLKQLVRVLIKNLSSDFCLLWLTWRRFTIQALGWHFRSNCWEQPKCKQAQQQKIQSLAYTHLFCSLYLTTVCDSRKCPWPSQWVYKPKNPCWVRDRHFLSMQCLFQFPDCYFNFLFTLFLAGSWFTFMTLQELTLALMAKP